MPDSIRDTVRRRVWEQADQLGWSSLSPLARSQQYANWTIDPEIGGVLSRFMDASSVRGYLKDSVLKIYARGKLVDTARPLRVLGLGQSSRIIESYIKPVGCRLDDGRVICWGRADDWKAVVLALHERTFHRRGWTPFAAVLMHARGREPNQHLRAMVEDAARKLCIERVVWLDGY